jgi:hypothetical protein
MGNGPTDDQETAERSNWTIKAFSVEARLLALACAAKRGESMPVWAERAVRNQATTEAGDQVLPPGEPVTGRGQRDGQHGQPAELPAVVTAAMGTSELAVLVQALQATSAATGRPAPRDVAGHVYGLMRTRLREARGLAPVRPRQPPREVEHSPVVIGVGRGMPSPDDGVE